MAASGGAHESAFAAPVEFRAERSNAGRSALDAETDRPDEPPLHGIAAAAEDETGVPCRSDRLTLCLQDDRYEVRAEWWSGDGQSGPAYAVRERTDESGLFQFFGPQNWEVLIKVLDACAVNRHVWVYAASSTDLGYRIVVRDTRTGAVVEYGNEAGRPAPAITDSSAFPDSCSS